MRLSLTIIVLSMVFLESCRNDTSKCTNSEKDISAFFKSKTILTSKSDSTKEIRDIGKDTVTGGYYTFKKGLLKSYYFFIKGDSIYTPKAGDELIEKDETREGVSFCSYAEFYDDKGQLTNTVGSPVVYNYIKLIKQDTISVNAKFFSLNKLYGDIQIVTNTHYATKCILTEDSLFTNMKQGRFQFYIGKQEDVQIYINGTFRQDCSKETKTFADTILLSYKNGKLKSSG